MIDAVLYLSAGLGVYGVALGIVVLTVSAITTPLTAQRGIVSELAYGSAMLAGGFVGAWVWLYWSVELRLVLAALIALAALAALSRAYAIAH